MGMSNCSYSLEIVSSDYLIKEKFCMYNPTSAHALACPHIPILLCSFIFALPDICAPNTTRFHYRNYYTILPFIESRTKHRIQCSQVSHRIPNLTPPRVPILAHHGSFISPQLEPPSSSSAKPLNDFISFRRTSCHLSSCL